MPPSLPTMLGIAVPTIVVSREASDIPNISAIVTVILAFLVICAFACLKLRSQGICIYEHTAKALLFHIITQTRVRGAMQCAPACWFIMPLVRYAAAFPTLTTVFAGYCTLTLTDALIPM